MSPHYFPASYQASRARFRQNLSRVQRYWPTARLEHHTINPDEDLTIDWICADALEDKRHQVIFTTGEHGVEGFVGSAILQLFSEEFLGSLDAHRTGLLLVHAINPWGMHNWRRVNSNNVDLNRNFIWGPGGPDLNSNPDYRLLQGLLNPTGAVKSIPSATTVFALRLLSAQLRFGANRFKNAALMGQYHTSSGIYYGGSQLQPETRMLMELYEQHTRSYEHILHMDMHTGYGPRYQMSLVNSALESRSSVDFARSFGYPLVVKTNAAEFYPIQGDMVDWVYHHVQETVPGARLYATAFEFGTFGDSLPAMLRSLRATIFENRLHQHGAANDDLRGRIRSEYRELFYPSEARWREKALADARKALRGILTAEGFYHKP